MSRNYVALCCVDGEDCLRAFELPNTCKNNISNAVSYYGKKFKKLKKGTVTHAVFSLKVWQDIKWINNDGSISPYSGFKAWDEET